MNGYELTAGYLLFLTYTFGLPMLLTLDFEGEILKMTSDNTYSFTKDSGWRFQVTLEM